MNIFEIPSFIKGLTLPRPEEVGITPSSVGFDADVPEVALPDKTEYTRFGTPMVAPLKFKKSSDTINDWWLFPIEPLITIDGENILVRRNVAKVPSTLNKRRGTIKERWMQGDYAITIEGVFIDNSTQLSFPVEDTRRLKEFCESREAIDVQCPLFEALHIDRIVIDKWNLPFTKGIENQSFRITAFSDDDWDLLIKIKNNAL